MSLPADMTPGEKFELQRFLGQLDEEGEVRLPGEQPAPVSDAQWEHGNIEDSQPIMSISQPLTIGAPIPAHIDLTVGTGMWKAHVFTLSPEGLKAVLKIVADTIAFDLTAEIARLHDEAK